MNPITFFGQWMNLPPGALCSLGSSRENGVIGQTAVVGSRLWVSHFKFRLRIALGFPEFRRLLPNGVFSNGSKIGSLTMLVENLFGTQT